MGNTTKVANRRQAIRHQSQCKNQRLYANAFSFLFCVKDLSLL